MAKETKNNISVRKRVQLTGYKTILREVARLLESARRASARATNAIMTATYWEIGHRIVEFEQRGRMKADYGEQLMERLSEDLTQKFGRGFGKSNLFQMRVFYIAYSSIFQTLSGKFTLSDIAKCFPLPWSHYIRLLSLKNPKARSFYEKEAIRGGWTVRQMERQIGTQFYERTILSRDKAAMLNKGVEQLPADAVTPEEEIKDPLILEFLGLKDEYSESDLEDSLIRQLENFLLELGRDFTFVGRQRRLRIGDEWYRVDLLFYHRRLRCLVIIDLKLGRFTHADAGQMHLYLNYAR